MASPATKTAPEAHAAVERADLRSTFTVAYKARVFAECGVVLANDCTEGEIRRRAGRYLPHLHDWRRQRTDGGQSARAGKRGRPPLDPRCAPQQKVVACRDRTNGVTQLRLHRLDVTPNSPRRPEPPTSSAELRQR